MRGAAAVIPLGATAQAGPIEPNEQAVLGQGGADFFRFARFSERELIKGQDGIWSVCP